MRFSMVDLPLFEVQSKIVGLGVLLLVPSSWLNPLAESFTDRQVVLSYALCGGRELSISSLGNRLSIRFSWVVA